MHVLVRGGWQQRIRLGAGLILFAFAALHFINTGLGLVSLSAVETFDAWRISVTRSLPGTCVLGAALLVHIGLAVYKLVGRLTLRLPRWELFQIATGLAIPLLLFPHIVNTRLAATLFGVHDTYPYELLRLWQDSSISQSFLLLLVWIHGCVGLHFWLRLAPGYRTFAPILLVLATLVPAAGIAGFAAGGAEVVSANASPAAFAAFKASVHWPSDHADTLQRYREWTWYGYGTLLGLVVIILLTRTFLQSRRPRIPIAYVGGPQVTAPVGPTLLEVSRAYGVPHACVCGGRARCSTCRVQVVEGLETLAPPSPAERDTLASIKASPDTRLACQIRVVDRASVLRIVTPGRVNGVDRGGAVGRQGEGRTLAVLFFDLRGFTRMSNGRLPYDVVFILNHLFAAVGDAIEAEGGWIDKYMGDGLMALFGRETGPRIGSQQALRACRRIDEAVERVSGELKSELGEPLAIGMGLHVGPLVLGEIGHRESARITVIGDAVNTASRLEALTKSPACQLIFSSAVAELSGLDVTNFAPETVEIRGVREPISIYRIRRARALDLKFDRKSTLEPAHSDLIATNPI